MALRIGITGGGSGGHFYPLIAVVDELQQRGQGGGVDIRYFGSAGDFREALEKRGISISHIFSSKLRRYFSLLNFFDGIKFILSFFQALFKFLLFMPDALFSKGGPGSFAIVLVAKFYRIPIMIHESDAVPGRSNMLAAKFADRIAVSFPQAAQYFAQQGITNVALTGNPVRRDLWENIPQQADAKRQLGFNPEKPLILILGGSQGAGRINEFIVKNIAEITQSYQVLHQTGAAQFEGVRQLTGGAQNYKPTAFIGEDLKTALSAADVILARAGAGTIFEIAAFGKPSILIPIPEAVVGAHQKANAYSFADTGAAAVIEEENLLPSIFMNQVKKIVENRDVRASMEEAAKKYFKPDAGKMIAEEILRLAGQTV